MLWSWLFSLVLSAVGVVVAVVVLRRGPQPRYGPWPAVRRQFAQYGTLGCRASRSEYWWPFLISLLVGTLLQGAELLAGHGAVRPVEVLRAVVSAVTMLPALAVTARRLHDTGRSAWWSLLMVTIVGIPWVLWWLSRPSQVGPNPWGPGPGTPQRPREVEGQPRPWTATGPPRLGVLWSSTTVTAVLLLAVSDISTAAAVRPDASSGWGLLAQLVGGLLLAVGIIALRGAPLFTSSAPGDRVGAGGVPPTPPPR